MTNKEAIEQLLPLAKYSVDKNGVGTFPMVSTPLQAEAIDLAIKALEFIEKYFPNSFNSYLNGEQIW